MKRCKVCFQQKPHYLFYASKNQKDGRRSACVECWKTLNKRTPEQNKQYRVKNIERIREYDRNRRKSSPEKLSKKIYDLARRRDQTEKNRDRLIRKKYGVTLFQYKQMLSAQDQCCDICGDHQSKQKRSLCIDHDHTTGKIRSLLCNNCNRCLGLLKDRPEVLSKAIRYLKKHNTNQVKHVTSISAVH